MATVKSIYRNGGYEYLSWRKLLVHIMTEVRSSKRDGSYQFLSWQYVVGCDYRDDGKEYISLR